MIRNCKVWLSQILILPQRLAGGKRIDRGIIMFQFQRWIVCVDFWPTVWGGGGLPANSFNLLDRTHFPKDSNINCLTAIRVLAGTKNSRPVCLLL